jgi:integrase
MTATTRDKKAAKRGPRAIPGIYYDAERDTWFFVVDAPTPKGTPRRQIWCRGFPSQDAANEARDRKRAEIKAGRVPMPDDGTVAAFVSSWVAALPAEGLEPSTIKHYAESVARLMPTIGDLVLQDLTAFDLDRAYGELRELGREARTIRASHVAFRKMLTEAQRLGIVGKNVANEARPPKASAARAKRFQIWTYDQMKMFLEAVADTDHAAFWTIAAGTGMRLGEMVALRWGDVDFDDANVTVRHAVGNGQDGVYDKEPKSKASARTVELDAPLLAVFRQHRKAQLERRVSIGEGWRDADLVFCEADGSAIPPNRQSKRWTDLVRRKAPALDVPLPCIRLHDLRHSHATQLLEAEVRADVVTERLGHESVAFTLQRYGHRYAGDQRSALARLRERHA